MSSKVNILEIVAGHIGTLVDPKDRRSIADYVTFFLVPLLVAGLGLMAGYNLNKDVVSMLVNFGAIFTALLLSVLVLVYEQENKLDAISGADPLIAAKKKLLKHLYYNICFSIVGSVFLVALCFLHTVIFKLKTKFFVGDRELVLVYSQVIVTPLIIFVMSNLLLTIVMIVKRMHAMLTIRAS